MFSSLRIRWASASLHSSAMRTAIWPMRAAGQRIGAGQRLRTQQHMDAERAALAHEAVEQQRRVLGELVVGDEEFLEFVDDQQRARHRHRRARRGGSRRGPARRAGGTARRGGRSSWSSRSSTLTPNSRSLSMAITRACGSAPVA